MREIANNFAPIVALQRGEFKCTKISIYRNAQQPGMQFLDE